MELGLGNAAAQAGWIRDYLAQKSKEGKSYAEILGRLQQKEPLTKILGETEFYGRTFVVSHDVLDPRPDTEHLVDRVLREIAMDEPTTVLDLGTGSGCLAITLAAERPLLHVTAVDVSSKALKIAEINAKNLGVSDRITFLCSDWLKDVPMNRYDGIVSNPPYIKRDVVDRLDDSVRLFDPAVALEGGEDGLVAYRTILGAAPDFLIEKGWLAFEIGFDQAADIRRLALLFGFELIEIIKDYQRHDRVAYLTHISTLGISEKK